MYTNLFKLFQLHCSCVVFLLSGIGVVTFVGLCCDPIHSIDATAIREAILSRGHRDFENKTDSNIVRRLLQLYTPVRTRRGTRKRKAGKRTGNMLALDHAPLPEFKHPPKIAYAANFVGLWTHVTLDIDTTAVDPAAIITKWHMLYTEFVMGNVSLNLFP